MKRLFLSLLVAQIICTLIGGQALAFPGDPIASGGGTGTTNASDLSSGTLPAARIGDNSVTTTKVQCIGTKDNTTFLRMDGTCAAPAGTGTVTEVSPDNVSELSVATATLDNLLQSQFDGKRLLIKMDLEGNEWEALQGAKRTLTRDPRPIWMVEIVDFAFDGGVHPHRADIFSMFKLRGYGTREIGKGNWRFE